MGIGLNAHNYSCDQVSQVPQANAGLLGLDNPLSLLDNLTKGLIPNVLKQLKECILPALQKIIDDGKDTDGTVKEVVEALQELLNLETPR